jgi:hypothetical protein
MVCCFITTQALSASRYIDSLCGILHFKPMSSCTRQIATLQRLLEDQRDRLAQLEQQLKHKLCYKCAANAKLQGTEFRVVVVQPGRLFIVEEKIGTEWQTLTRRKTRREAEAAIEETKQYRTRKEERRLRLDMKVKENRTALAEVKERECL